MASCGRVGVPEGSSGEASGDTAVRLQQRPQDFGGASTVGWHQEQ